MGMYYDQRSGMINEEYTSTPQHIKPRLQHIEPGQFFTLLEPRQNLLLLRKDGDYGYTEHGRIGLSAELDPENMVFGDGKGWRLRS